MALAKESTRQTSQSSFPSGFNPTLDFLGFKGHHGSMMMEEGNCSETLLHNPMSNLMEYNMNSVPQEMQSKNIAALGHWPYSSSSSSVLSFEQGDRNIASSSAHSKLDQEGECGVWMDGMDEEFQESDRLARDASNCFEMESGYGSVERQYEERFGLVYPSVASSIQSFHEGGQVERTAQKRPYTGGDMQFCSKKHCNKKATKAKSYVSKDPQSIAAKNRRERISERLKVLQDLVPNGTKVDLVTMLEKAISYVKFLQLQVKVLATDEFWPAQGGKAPEISQVKEAIDAILSSHSHRDHRTTGSSSKQ